jgi:di/tricarboxylate transporter
MYMPLTFSSFPSTRTTAGLAKLLVCALLTAAVMCAFGILSQQEARDSINWEVFVTVASAFGIGTALVNSGVAGGVAGFLVRIGTSVGSGCKCLQGKRAECSLFPKTYVVV